jgi:hypothetical protein
LGISFSSPGLTYSLVAGGGKHPPRRKKMRSFDHEFFLLSINSVAVSAGIPVVTLVIAEAYAEGQSGFAHATINFSKRMIGQGIKAQQVCFIFRGDTYP